MSKAAFKLLNKIFELCVQGTEKRSCKYEFNFEYSAGNEYYLVFAYNKFTGEQKSVAVAENASIENLKRTKRIIIEMMEEK